MHIDAIKKEISELLHQSNVLPSRLLLKGEVIEVSWLYEEFKKQVPQSAANTMVDKLRSGYEISVH